MTQSKFVGEVTLRTTKRVFLEPDQYRIESADRRGNKHGSYVPASAVAAAMAAWDGQTLTAEQATSQAETTAEDWGLPYTYGHKLRYAVQDLLVAMAAESVAIVTPEGRGFSYQVSAGPLSQLANNDLTEPDSPVVGIKELAAAGENQRVEFKSSLVYDFKNNAGSKDRALDILRTVAGFLNTDGGLLLVGVTDDGEICGLSADYKAGGSAGDADRWVLYLRTQLQNAIGHSHWDSISCEIEAVDGAEVARISVKAGKEPAFVKWRGEKMYFVRTLNATQKLDMEAAFAHVRTRFG